MRNDDDGLAAPDLTGVESGALNSAGRLSTQYSRPRSKSELPVIVIMGAGVGGVGVALALAKLGYQVVLLDRNGQILLGSSNATPGRAGQGYHYIKYKTGKRYLDATIKVLREFPGCTLGAGKSEDHYMRHGIYLIMKEEEALRQQNKGGEDQEPEKQLSKKIDEFKKTIREQASTLSNLYNGNPRDAEQIFITENKLEKLEHQCQVLKLELDKMQQNKYEKKFATLFPANKILETYEKLREAYRKKIDEDSKNKLFGDAGQFFRIRNKKDFENIVDVSKVDTVVDTHEELLNWPKVRTMLCEKIDRHPRITVHTQTNVTGLSYDPDSSGFIIKTNQGKFKADYVVNSTWENIERINWEMGFPMQPNSRTNRLKVIIKVKLPPALREESSMFACIGAHMMYSNMGNGEGMVTYAPTTNIRSSTDLTIDKEMAAFLHGDVDREDTMKLARDILAGAAQYIPPLANAEICDVGFGIVKTLGKVDVFDPSSDFHRRDYSGVQRQQIRVVSNACMKLLFFLGNAKLVAQYIQEDMAASTVIDDITKRIAASPVPPPLRQKDIRRAIRINIERNHGPEQILKEHDQIAEKMRETVGSKASLMPSTLTINDTSPLVPRQENTSGIIPIEEPIAAPDNRMREMRVPILGTPTIEPRFLSYVQHLYQEWQNIHPARQIGIVLISCCVLYLTIQYTPALVFSALTHFFPSPDGQQECAAEQTTQAGMNP